MPNHKTNNRCLVCGSSESDLGEYPTTILGKYMHQSCRKKRLSEARKDHVSFEKWMKEYHSEIGPEERKRLDDEAELNTPIEFIENTSTEKFEAIELSGRSAKCKQLLGEFGKYREPVLRQELIELYDALGLSREEAEQELTRPRAVEPRQNTEN